MTELRCFRHVVDRDCGSSAYEVFVSMLERAKWVSFFGLFLAGVMLHLVSICVYCLGVHGVLFYFGLFRLGFVVSSSYVKVL